MFDLRPYQQPERCLADHLPWFALVNPHTLLNKDGSYSTVLRYRGPDVDSTTDYALLGLRARLNNVLTRLGDRWCLHFEARRQPTDAYPAGSFDRPAAALIDQERARSFADATQAFETRTYLTLTYLPPEDRSSRLADVFIELPPDEVRPNPQRQYYEQYRATVAKVVSLLEGFCPDLEVLERDELMTFLHGSISPRPHFVACPDSRDRPPMFLAERLCDAPLEAGLGLKLGGHYVASVGVRSWPPATTPGALSRLCGLPLSLRWGVRWLPMDRLRAEKQLNTLKRHWFSKRKNLWTMMREVATKEESRLESSDATRKADEVEATLAMIGADEAAVGHLTMSIHVTAETEEAALAKARVVQEVTDGLGWVTEVERVNALQSWLGSLPGHAYADVRRPLLNSLNLCDVIPFAQAWRGETWNTHLDAPCLLQARTEGSTPFAVNLHQGDVGHTLIAGPTGAGKSTLLNLLAAQWMRYDDAQVYFFDKGGSCRVLTYANGGDFYDLGTEGVSVETDGNAVPAGGTALGFQPLAELDADADRAWAAEWIAALVEGEQVRVDAAGRGKIWEAIGSLAGSPRRERTVSGLCHLLQDRPMKEALRPFCVGGAFGALFDAESDPLHAADADLFNGGRWQAFEMEQLMSHPRATAAALAYLFHVLEKRFASEDAGGRPTLLILDEAWLFLDHPLFRSKIREWLKTLRKRNVSVVFATQSIADIAQSDIAPAIIESCLTRILLPNAAAAEPATREVYEKLLGLNDRQLATLATATPKRHYYYTSQQGNRLIDLGLSKTELALVAAARPQEQAAAWKLLAKVGKRGFCEAWLRRAGLAAAADEAAEAGRAAARLMAFDAGTEQAVAAAAREAADDAIRRVARLLRRVAPEVADEVDGLPHAGDRDDYPDPHHADVPISPVQEHHDEKARARPDFPIYAAGLASSGRVDRRLRVAFVAAALVGASVAAPRPALALFGVGDVVFDPQAQAKNVAKVLAMTRELEQMNRQLQQLQRQIEDLGETLSDPGGDAFDKAKTATDGLTRLGETLARWTNELPATVEPGEIGIDELPERNAEINRYLRDRLARAELSLARRGGGSSARVG